MIRLGKREVLIETRLGVGDRVAALATNLIALVFLSALIAGCGKSSTPGAKRKQNHAARDPPADAPPRRAARSSAAMPNSRNSGPDSK